MTSPASKYFTVDTNSRLTSAALPVDREIARTTNELNVVVAVNDCPQDLGQLPEAIAHACSGAMEKLANEACRSGYDTIIGVGVNHSVDTGAGLITVVAYGTAVMTSHNDRHLAPPR